MKRKTITFSDDLYARVQKLRGKRIADSGKPVSFSKLIGELVASGLGLEEIAPGQFPDKEVRQLVKDYALECNAMLLGKENKAIELYYKIWSFYLQPSQYTIVADEAKRLIESNELPEPILNEWRKGQVGSLTQEKASV